MFVAEKNNEVLLADGTTLSLKDMQPSVMVIGTGGVNTVSSVMHSKIKETLWSINEGLILGFSSDTLILTLDGWAAIDTTSARKKYPNMEIRKLMQGDKVLLVNAGSVIAESIESFDAEGQSGISILLDGDHTLSVNGVLIHNGGGDEPAPPPSTTTSIIEPPKFLQPFLKTVAEEAESAFQLTPRGGFQGEILAPVDPRQREALTSQETIARSLGPDFGTGVSDIATQQIERVLSGDILGTAGDVSAFQPINADLSGIISAALNPVQERLQEEILPGITSAAITQGAFGGTRADIEEGKAVREFGRTATDITSKIVLAELERTEGQRLEDLISRRGLVPDLERLTQTAALTAPDLQQAGVQQQLVPSQLIGQVGAGERQLEQEVLDAEFRQFQIDTSSPFAGINEFATILAGTPFGQTNVVTAQGGAPAGGGGGGVGGALAGGLGAGLGAAAVPGLAAATGAFAAGAPLALLGGPVGIAGAVILGGLLGADIF